MSLELGYFARSLMSGLNDGAVTLNGCSNDCENIFFFFVVKYLE